MELTAAVDYSLYGLIVNADPVVKVVMLVLGVGSRLGPSFSIKMTCCGAFAARFRSSKTRSTRSTSIPSVPLVRAAQSEIDEGAIRGESRRELCDWLSPPCPAEGPRQSLPSSPITRLALSLGRAYARGSASVVELANRLGNSQLSDANCLWIILGELATVP